MIRISWMFGHYIFPVDPKWTGVFLGKSLTGGRATFFEFWIRTKKWLQTDSTNSIFFPLDWTMKVRFLWKEEVLLPYPCSHFYFDINFGDRLYLKEKRPGSPLLFWIKYVAKFDIKAKVTIWIGHIGLIPIAIFLRFGFLQVQYIH